MTFFCHESRIAPGKLLRISNYHKINHGKTYIVQYTHTHTRVRTTPCMIAMEAMLKSGDKSMFAVRHSASHSFCIVVVVFTAVANDIAADTAVGFLFMKFAISFIVNQPIYQQRTFVSEFCLYNTIHIHIHKHRDTYRA